MNDQRFQTAIAVIPVVSAGLYLLGVTYHQGYLDAFGIEDSLFPLATDKSLLFGFFAFASVGLVPMAYAMFAAAVLVVGVMVVALLSSRARLTKFATRFFSALASLRMKEKPSELLVNWMDKSGTAYLYIAGFVFVTVSLVFSAVVSAKSGSEQARLEIDNFKNQRGNWVMLYSPSLGSPIRAKQITCGPAFCAFWLGSESLILGHERIDRVIARNAAFATSMQK